MAANTKSYLVHTSVVSGQRHELQSHSQQSPHLRSSHDGQAACAQTMPSLRSHNYCCSSCFQVRSETRSHELTPLILSHGSCKGSSAPTTTLCYKRIQLLGCECQGRWGMEGHHPAERAFERNEPGHGIYQGVLPSPARGEIVKWH